MPDKPLTVITYAASASLAAVALVYFFNPNYLIDGDHSPSSSSSRKKGVIGLSNPANDCFINCVLQALAGLGDLRLYLIRETHRRELGGAKIYASVPVKDVKGRDINPQKLISLQGGEVTQGLKEMINRLNERPIYKKIISAAPFIQVLEHAFGTRIAKTQQDAQEMLQIVAERLFEEYYAGREARKRAKSLTERPNKPTGDPGDGIQNWHLETAPITESTSDADRLRGPKELEAEEGFPLEGQTETRIECQYCHFIPKAIPTSFVMLTLSVPQKSSTSLNECFDSHFKTEYIDDYKCDRCRLVHATQVKKKQLSQARSSTEASVLESEILRLGRAIEDDPEKVPEGIKLPDSKVAPKRKIGKYVEMTRFPKILIIHLSRSIFDVHSSSLKNLSKVTFPERMPVGGLLKRKDYKLLGVVCHKGTHNNGHYETFRRQHSYAPYSNPHLDRSSGPYGSTSLSELSLGRVGDTPGLDNRVEATKDTMHANGSASASSSNPSRQSESRSSESTRPTSGSTIATTSVKTEDTLAPNKTSFSSSGVTKPSFSTYRSSKAYSSEISRTKRKKRHTDRWWRISDDKIKECRTNDVLSMEREVYMLFYEAEKEDGLS